MQHLPVLSCMSLAKDLVFGFPDKSSITPLLFRVEKVGPGGLIDYGWPDHCNACYSEKRGCMRDSRRNEEEARIGNSECL
jgi:hypothetical protein